MKKSVKAAMIFLDELHGAACRFFARKDLFQGGSRERASRVLISFGWMAAMPLPPLMCTLWAPSAWSLEVSSIMVEGSSEWDD